MRPMSLESVLSYNTKASKSVLLVLFLGREEQGWRVRGRINECWQGKWNGSKERINNKLKFDCNTSKSSVITLTSREYLSPSKIKQ